MSKSGQNMLQMNDTDKAARVSIELKRLSDLFEGVEENRKDFIRKQLEQLAWLNISIADLQERIDRFGTLVMYDNGGGQSGVKPNPDLKTLIDYQKLANTIVRTLNSVIPIKEAGRPGDSKLFDFFSEDSEIDHEAEMAAYEEKQRRINEEIAAAQRKLDESRKAQLTT